MPTGAVHRIDRTVCRAVSGRNILHVTSVALLLLYGPTRLLAEDVSWNCQILPAEHAVTVDPTSGAKTVFITTNKGVDQNLYFHQRSWLADESLVVFFSSRTGRREPFAYIESTGELVRIGRPEDVPLTGVTCARRANRVYGIRGGEIVVLDVTVAPKTGDTATRVRMRQRVLGHLPANGRPRGSLTENSTGRYLSLAYSDTKRAGINHIGGLEIDTGRLIPIATVDFPVSHLQFSWTRPDLVMFARSYPEGDRVDRSFPADQPPHYRLWNADFSRRPPWPLFAQKPGELVTHECWWTEDRLTFCGGFHPHESHVKVFDLKSRKIAIVAAGSWWPEGREKQIARRAWWHAAGSPNGRWVVADTFHGDITLFDAKTTEERPLSRGHLTLGRGEAHPHVGWAPSSTRVIFTSNQRGNPDVVIAHVPKQW